MPIRLDFGLFGHSGSAPSPFDALNGPRLAGPQGSHPLHGVQPHELLRSSNGPVSGEISLDAPAVVGQGITGRIELTASGPVAARRAYLRLVGLRLDEVRRSEEHRDSEGRVTSSEHWVETQGKLFVQDAFLEPAIPTVLASGETWQAAFAVPAPQLGPPAAHLGESIVAWALEVRWDVPHAADQFVATYLPIAQNPDLLRAGVGRQGGASLFDCVQVGDATISVASPLPAPAGSDVLVRIDWPSVPHGSNGRVEIHRRTNAPNGIEGIVASAAVAPESLSTGDAEVRLAIPPGSPPSFDGAGLEIDYVVRVLVDRRLRPDAAIERPVAIV